MNKPIITSGLLKQLSIGNVRKEPRIVPRDATGLGIVGLLVAEVKGDAEGNVLNECESTAGGDSYRNYRGCDRS